MNLVSIAVCARRGQLAVVLRAKRDALMGLGSALARRREIQSSRVIGSRQLLARMARGLGPLTDSRRRAIVMLARNALLNLAGHAAPLAAALIAFPVLVARLDPDRLGFLSIAWVLVGYFSLFDLGLGRALSRLVAERTGTPDETKLPELSQTALGLTAGSGRRDWDCSCCAPPVRCARSS